MSEGLVVTNTNLILLQIQDDLLHLSDTKERREGIKDTLMSKLQPKVSKCKWRVNRNSGRGDGLRLSSPSYDGNATVASSRVAGPGLWLLRLPPPSPLWLVTSLITSHSPHCLDFIDLSHVHSHGLSGELKWLMKNCLLLGHRGVT